MGSSKQGIHENLLIGKSVRVTVEYTRSSNNSGKDSETPLPPRVYATIKLQNKSKRNAAEALVGGWRGYPSSSKERSGEHDKLLVTKLKQNGQKRKITFG